MAETLDERLEAGWQALDEGRLADAKLAANQAEALDLEAPEVPTLRGAILQAEGDHVGAMAAWKRAMKMDEAYFEPVLLSAQLAGADGDLDAALKLAERALDTAEEEDDYLEALLLKAEIELGLDDGDAAAQTLAELPPPPVELPSPELHVRAGAAFLELDDLDQAEHHFQAATKLDDEHADAHHGLGLVAEARGEDTEMKAHWKRTRSLDLAAPRPSWAIDDERLESLVEAALRELPERARTLLANVPILVEDYPSEELLDDGLDPRLYGLFTGTPYPDQGNLAGTPVTLEHILLFRRNLERDARTTDEVEQEIRTTLLHETGHFFGMDEEDLEEVGLD
jgi:predicted Zn-dependent protease with MMP-like domain/Tfp pilus assembly protein PilF